jgi:transposase
LRISVRTLLDAGKSQREIERVLGVDRKTIRRIQQQSKSPGVPTGNCAGKTGETAETSEQNPPPRPPTQKPVATPSACELHREWIESQVALRRNAMSIYQDLCEKFGFTHQYTSVKRFVARLKAREPERFDVLDALPGEEAQVDFGQGALTRLPIPQTVSVRDDAQVLG